MATNINLTFPPEIRDMVNRFVFKQGNPILLIPQPAATGLLAPLFSSYPIPDVGILTLSPFYHAEASDILYGENTFLVSTLPNTCWDAASLGLLTAWLRSIGPNYRDKVRRVLIDLSPLCPLGSLYFRGYVDLAPIMREVWRFQNRIAPGKQMPDRAKIQISFTLSGRQLHGGHMHASFQVVPPTRVINLPNLNNVTTLLSPDSRPRMRLYLSTPRVLREIRVRIDGGQVLFVLATPRHQDISDMGQIEFNLNANGQLVQNLANNPGLTIWDILHATTPQQNLLGMILEAPSSRKLTYNMNNGTISEDLPVAFWINQRFREESLSIYGSIHVIAKLSSRHINAPMRCFGCWKNWIIGSRLFTEQERTRESNAPTILTRFELSQEEDLANLRIPATNCIIATLELPEHTQVRVELSCPNKYVVNSTKRLYKVQRQLMVFLMDLLDGHPTRRNNPGPEVWMDGHCKIVEGEFANPNGGSLSVRNRKHNWSGTELEQRKDDCVSDLVEQVGPFSEGADDRADDFSLHGMALRLATFLSDSI